MTKIREWYKRLANPVKAGIATAIQTFVGMFSLALLGFFNDVQRWAGADTAAGEFPSVDPLGKAFVSALAAAVVGAVALIFRSIKPGPVYEGSPVQPGTGLTPQGTDRGAINAMTVLISLGIAVLIVILIKLVDVNVR